MGPKNYESEPTMRVECWIVIVSATLTFGHSCKNEARCPISRIHGMKGADCFKKDFRDFPQCLGRDVEIIDLSLNRIRKLTATDLNRYTDLKMLYLSDNMIMAIDEDAFGGMDDLHTLDLAINGISKLPSGVFQLPSLKSLYLGQNMNINIIDAVDRAKPITSPLGHFDISYTTPDGEYVELPDLGAMPYLTKYNISGNKVAMLSTKHVAGLCKLRLLDSANVTVDFSNKCDCWTINRWLVQRNVKFTPFPCTISETSCFDSVDDNDMKSFESCQRKVEEMIKKSMLIKIFVPIGVIAIVILCGVLYYYLKRKNRKNRIKKNQAPPKPDGQKLIS